MDKDKYKVKDQDKVGVQGPNDEEIIRAAIEGLKENELHEEWASIFSKTRPGQPYKVQLLNADDDSGGFYYIVPFMAEDRIPLAVKVGGSPVKFQQAIAAETSDEDVISIISPMAARDIPIGVTLRLADDTSIRIGKDNIPEQMPFLAWEPCVESFSPFWPFYLLTIVDKAQAKRTICVRALDGKTFSGLTTDKGGA